ncbi:hypothetical protein PILCRDRAFT_99249 [Piloderma croceum F 1598]|uniref:UBC core domain-containing protein n=1 Tax=Piloderma croceum (strain F 1598) TaxID=765440 RepID=A0A0C3F1D5_PILCF|nr:hypothetical protein PILCRDRAFT_99249 [Piloderma croceum F 1598]
MSDDEGMYEEDTMDVDDFEDFDEPSPAPSVPLKGRKRFLADLEEMKKFSVIGFGFHGFDLRNLRAGDDEGTIEFKIMTSDGHPVLSANLLVSDPSEYPDHHTFYAFSTSDAPSHIGQVVEDVSSGKSRSIKKTFEDFLSAIHKASREDDDGEADAEADAYDAYDEDDNEFGASRFAHSTLRPKKLQYDFLEVVAAGYRPGLIRFGVDDFSLSISIPVIKLANDIPARALMAWDRRLLSRTQHLTLLISGLRGTYPPLKADGTLTQDAVARGTNLQFKVGLSRQYKPSKEYALEAKRTYGLVDDEAQQQERPLEEEPLLTVDGFTVREESPHDEDEDDDGRFDSFSLSSSLETLLDHSLVRVIQTRIKYGLGWAGAETLVAETERLQQTTDDVIAIDRQLFDNADKTERKLRQTYNLPPDPLVGRETMDELNLPLVAFCYLIRRLTLCTRYCLVCHNKLNTDFEVLKPYVCDSKLCSYQFYAFNRGPSLEYEIISNPETVDLLVSIAYTAAADQCLNEPLPLGMGLRVPVPDARRCVVPLGPTWGHAMAPVVAVPKPVPPTGDPDGLCEFDEMDIISMRASIAEMIHALPPIREMRRHLLKKTKAGKSKPKLKDMDSSIPTAAWLILRWCVASCTAHLEELTSDEDLVRNIDSTWRQFRFTIGAPDAEARFKAAVAEAQKTDANARKYPGLYAFHGSPLKNWHSIIRHGLWFKTIAHGRAYGDGVYFAKDGSTSMGGYAQGTSNVWRHSQIAPRCCVAVAEIVNQPSKFVSNNPHYVVNDTNWIICRYLLVKTGVEPMGETEENTKDVELTKIPLVKLDPAHPLTLTSGGRGGGQKHIQFPEPSYKLEKLLKARRKEYLEEDFDEDDQAIFEAKETPANSQREVIVIENSPPPSKAPALDDWKHDAEWVTASTAHLMPPPFEASPSATMALQRELRAMVKEQESATSLKDLGWYMPPDLIGDNLFQWIVELHSFEETLPIAKGMKTAGINSIIFEIRFPPTFPLAPPFFRIIKPRLLPFIQGGGGHVTGGGSMCMDLLTSDGWLPSYSISAVLLQIKLAISNLEPRPAQLARNWDTPYGVQESLEGFKRAAATHGWKVPSGIDRLVR